MAVTVRPRTLDELLALAVAAADAQIHMSVHPFAAIRFGLTAAILATLGIPVPVIVSGYRTIERQKELHDTGLRAAQRSWHTVGLAYDLDDTSVGFDAFASIWKALGGRDGRDFSEPDPGHVDFPIQGFEPPAAF